MNLSKRLSILAAVAAAAILAATPAVAQERYPSKRLNWTIAFGPGGGNDIMSRTLISIRSSTDRALTQIWPPSGVYLAALSRRFESSWASRTASPMSHIGTPGSSTDSVCPRRPIWDCAVSTAAATTV